MYFCKKKKKVFFLDLVSFLKYNLAPWATMVFRIEKNFHFQFHVNCYKFSLDIKTQSNVYMKLNMGISFTKLEKDKDILELVK